MKWTLSIGLCLCGLLVFTQNLSKKEALEKSLQQNFDIQLSNVDVQQAQINNTWGEAGFLPSIDLGGNYRWDINNRNNPTSFINGEFVTNTLNYTADLNWTLFDGFRMFATKDKLELMEEKANGNLQLIIRNTLIATSLAYDQVLMQREKLSQLEEIKKTSQNRLKLMQKRKELALISSYDLLQLDSLYYSDSVACINGQLFLENALRNLKRIMNLPLEEPITCTDTFAMDASLLEYTALQNQLDKDNLDLQMLYLEENILKKDVDIARSGRYPGISLSSGINGSESTFKFEGQSRDGSSLNYYAMFGLSFRVFDGGRVNRSIETAKIGFVKNNIKKDQLKTNISYNLGNHYFSYKSLHQVYLVLKQSNALQKRNLNMSEAKFNSGLISSFDLMEVKRAYLSGVLQELETLYSFKEAKMELLRLSGSGIEMQ